MRILFLIALFPTLMQAQNLSQLCLDVLSDDYEQSVSRSVYLSSNFDTIAARQENEIYTRMDYYGDGSLKAEYKVKAQRYIRRDTTVDDTKTKIKFITENRLRDYPFGMVKEYHSAYRVPKTKSIIKTIAFVEEGKVKGILNHYPLMEDILITIEFNSDGKVEGEYSEYYNVKGVYSKLKCKGEYSYVARIKILFNPDIYEYKPTTVAELQKIGEWKYFKRNGKLESRQLFQWMDYNK